MPTITRPTASPSASTRAERLVERIKAMPIESIRARIAESQQMTSSEIVARQAVERRQRAEQAAARLRSI